MSVGLFDLKGRCALVTGSSQGIGLAIARGLASAGADIIINGRDRKKLESVAGTLQHGIRVHVAAFDVTDADAVGAAVDDIENTVGPIDILFNNAGMQYRTELENYPVEKWRELM